MQDFFSWLLFVDANGSKMLKALSSEYKRVRTTAFSSRTAVVHHHHHRRDQLLFSTFFISSFGQVDTFLWIAALYRKWLNMCEPNSILRAWERRERAGFIFRAALCGAKKLVPRTKWQEEFSAQQTGRPVVVLHCCIYARWHSLALLARKGRFCAVKSAAEPANVRTSRTHAHTHTRRPNFNFFSHRRQLGLWEVKKKEERATNSPRFAQTHCSSRKC